MSDTNEYDEIIAHAHRIGKKIHAPHIVGLSLPDHVSLPWMSSSLPHTSEDWLPFSDSTMIGPYRILLLPGHFEARRKQAIRTLKHIAADGLILMSSCIGLKEQFFLDSFVSIVDHIDLSGHNPLSGPNDERIGPRYPNMIHAYDKKWSDKGEEAAKPEDIQVQQVIYACVKGSTTPAEAQMLTLLGADVAGHDVVDDVIIANHCGMPVAALGYIESHAIPASKKQTWGTPDRLHAQQVRINQLLCRIFDAE